MAETKTEAAWDSEDKIEALKALVDKYYGELEVDGKAATVAVVPRDTFGDEDLSRYLRARCGDIDKALVMIKSTITWRQESLPKLRVCPLCPNDPSAHCLRCIGRSSRFDKKAITNSTKASIKRVDQSFIRISNMPNNVSTPTLT